MNPTDYHAPGILSCCGFCQPLRDKLGQLDNKKTLPAIPDKEVPGVFCLLVLKV